MTGNSRTPVFYPDLLYSNIFVIAVNMIYIFIDPDFKT